MGNFIAWSIVVSNHDSLQAAQKAANDLEMELDEDFRDRDDFGNGAIRSEFIIIHNGKNVI
jgi:hypothetical protein